MNTIGDAAVGIKAAQENLSKVAKASLTTKKDKKPLSIDKLKKRSAKLTAKLQKALKPLNDRLKPMKMLVWWDGEDYVINTQAADRSLGTEFRLDDHCLAQLMAMSDAKLETFLKGF